MQSWQRWREPLAVVLLVGLGLLVVVGAARLSLSLRAGDTMGLFGVQGDGLLLVVAAGAVLWCATPVADPGGEAAKPSPHAASITVVGVVVVGLTVLGWLAVAVWSVVTVASLPMPDVGVVLFMIEGLLRLMVPGVAVAAVVLAVRQVAAARRPGLLPPGLPAAADAPAETNGTTQPVVERLPAAWQPDEATGAVWLTADDAAQGRPGLSWADPPVPGEASASPRRGWAATPEEGESAPSDVPGSVLPGPSSPPRARPAAEDDDLH